MIVAVMAITITTEDPTTGRMADLTTIRTIRTTDTTPILVPPTAPLQQPAASRAQPTMLLNMLNTIMAPIPMPRMEDTLSTSACSDYLG